MLDVMKRLDVLREINPAVRLYALVDGLQYQVRFIQPLMQENGVLPILSGTQDAALAHAGPWLADVDLMDEDELAKLIELERALPSVTWIIASQDLRGLSQLMQIHLDVRLPNGRLGLLRFWDPRVLTALAETFDESQREAFFGHVEEWHLLNDGQRVWVGRHHA